MVRSTSFKNITPDIIIIGILVVVTLLSILPIVNAVAISLSSSSKASAGIVTFYPIGLNFESYKNILKESAFLQAFMVSVKRVALSSVLTFILCILAAYPLSKSKRMFKERNVYMWFFIFTMMFAPALIPLFITIRDLKLTGSIWSLVLPGAVNQYLIILVINYFRSIPKDVEECAEIDGAGPWRTLFQIIVPLSKPILATIVLFTIVWHWNAFFDGLIYMDKTEQYPLQTYIQQLVVNLDPSDVLVDGETSRINTIISNRTLNAAKIIITMVPILVLYPLLQRYFITGIMLGSVKE